MADRKGETGVRLSRRDSREGGEETELPPVVAQLVRTKERLTRELQANLRELRSVIKESQRIARELEMVLQEAQAPTAIAIPAGAARRWGRQGGDGLPAPGEAGAWEHGTEA